jgi:hypothetical protein
VSFTITVEGIDSVTSMLQAKTDAIQNAAEGLLEAAQDTAFAAAADASTIVWNVRTGNYSESLGMEETGAMSISIFFAADYAEALEYGWTAWHGAVVESPGVLIPAVMGSLDDLAEAFAQWLMTQ